MIGEFPTGQLFDSLQLYFHFVAASVVQFQRSTEIVRYRLQNTGDTK